VRSLTVEKLAVFVIITSSSRAVRTPARSRDILHNELREEPNTLTIDSAV